MTLQDATSDSRHQNSEGKETRLRAAEAKSSPVLAKWHDAEDLRWAVRHWAARIGVKPPQIHLRLMRQKWASVSTAGRITLNLELLDLPRELGEFVIVHELVHLLAPNHGKVFKSFMHAYIQIGQQREGALQRHAGG